MNKVLIAGRPNVGKSSLFNRLTRQKKALILNQPGVTRDILKQKCKWWGGEFEVWDSGGLWAKKSQLEGLINQQVKWALDSTHLILLVMDARSGLLDEDKKTFSMVKKSGKPFLILVNKVDDKAQQDLLLSDFYCFGKELLPCSFEKGEGVPEIVEWILSHNCSLNKTNKKNNKPICLLLTGQVNVGKSALANSLLRQNRSLVSPLAGTTLDVVKEPWKYGSRVYSLWDSAGFKGAKKTKMESLSAFKTSQSFESADLVLLLLDYMIGPNRLSARILDLCVKEHKPVIAVVNKWDLAKTHGDSTDLRAISIGKNKYSLSKIKGNTGPLNAKTKEEYRKHVQEQFRCYPHLPVVFVSALKSYGLGVLMKTVEKIYEKSCFQIATSELNQFFMNVIRKAPSPVYGTQNVKFYYLTQTKHVPPSFIAFANYPEGVRDSYKRFIIRQMQKQWNLKGVPLRLTVLHR